MQYLLFGELESGNVAALVFAHIALLPAEHGFSLRYRDPAEEITGIRKKSSRFSELPWVHMQVALSGHRRRPEFASQFMCKMIASWQLIGAEKTICKRKLGIVRQHLHLQLPPKFGKHGFCYWSRGN